MYLTPWCRQLEHTKPKVYFLIIIIQQCKPFCILKGIVDPENMCNKKTTRKGNVNAVTLKKREEYKWKSTDAWEHILLSGKQTSALRRQVPNPTSPFDNMEMM